MKLPILYHKGKSGELRQWRTWTEGSDILTEHGVSGGAMQTSRKTAEPKNVGKANETSPEEQAILESKSLWTYKVERKYSETPEGAQEQLPLPMLAHKFKGKKRSGFQYPGHAQRKLDGVRCLAQRAEDGSIALTSRGGKPWNIPLVAAQLDKWLPEGMVLDGELYIHGLSCQRITSLAKSSDPSGKSYKPESAGLIYHVYDMPTYNCDDTLMWRERNGLLLSFAESLTSDNVCLVETILVKNDAEVVAFEDMALSEHYEGLVVRTLSGRYIWGYRSNDLLKLKVFEDAEFTVLGGTDGVGKAKGTVVFICKNDLTDAIFDCTMKGVLAERSRFYREREQYMGKQLTVRFFGRTDAQIPRHPVGIVFRDEKDLPL